MANELVQYEGQQITPATPTLDALYMPIVQVSRAIERRNMLAAFARDVMTDGLDYGVIPGTGSDGKPGKKVLFKPGAEKLATFLGLVPDPIVQERILDFDGSEHNGEALIYYRVRCNLYRQGVLVGSGDASCNSRESKYRWRKAERVCPACGVAAIIKGKAEYGGGWVCFKKKDGCGATYPDGDSRIEGQTVGRVPNPDIADLDNTLLKMAEKRALIAAVLICTNMSDHFTQDIGDDDAIPGEYTVMDAPPATAPAPKGKAKQAQEPPAAPAPNGNGKAAPAAKPISEKTLKHLHALGVELYGNEWDSKRPAFVQWASTNRVTSSKELTETEAGYLVAKLAERKAAMQPPPPPPAPDEDVDFGMGDAVPTIHVEQPALVTGGGKVYQ